MKTVYSKLLLVTTLLIFSISSCNRENIYVDVSHANYAENRTCSRYIAELFDTRWWHYFKEGDYRSSLNKLNLMLELVELQYRHQVAEFYNRKSALHNSLGNDQWSLFYLRRAMEMEQIDNGMLARFRALRNFITLHPFEEVEQFEEIMDFEAIVRNSHIAQQQEIQYGIKKKTELLAQRTEDAQRKRITIIFLLIIIGLIVALAVFIILFYQNREQIKQENATVVRYYEEILELKQQIKMQDKGSEKNDASEKLACELQKLFETEKIYRQQGLNVEDVVNRLNTNSKYLSNVVSQRYGKNFTRYVNTYRLKEAIEILKQQQNKDSKYANYTIQAIAEEVGFSGKSSFYLAFKQIIGVAPLEYIRTLKTETKSQKTKVEL